MPASYGTAEPLREGVSTLSRGVPFHSPLCGNDGTVEDAGGDPRATAVLIYRRQRKSALWPVGGSPDDWG